MSTPTKPMRFAAAEIRAEMARQQLTQQQVAERMGVRQWWVSRRLTEMVRISTDDLVLFADALGVPHTNFLPPAARRRSRSAA